MADIHSSFPSLPSRRLGSPIAGIVAKWWAAYAAARERRASIAALHALDDRQLKDIGLHRSEIEWAVDRQSGYHRE